MLKNLLQIIVGSESDLKHLKPFLELLDELEVGHLEWVFSAHRHPDQLAQFLRTACGEGAGLFAGIAGRAADLPKTITGHVRGKAYVFGIPLTHQPEDPTGSKALECISLAPKGIPVSVQGIGEAGFTNTALQVAQIIAFSYPQVGERLQGWHKDHTPACGPANMATLKVERTTMVLE